MLALSAVLPDGPTVIHPVLIWDENDVILVDAGLPGQVPAFREEFAKAGVPFDRLNRIIVTHQDLDHIGGLREVLDSVSGKVEVVSHEVEAPYIQGDAAPTKMGKLQDLLKVVPEQKRPQIQALMQSMKVGYERLHVTVDRTVVHDEELPFCGGVTVIHTPGHTPGHISLYLRSGNVLVTGDALFCEGGRLVLPPAFFCSDPALAKESLKKLAAYDVETAVCYHGGVCKDDVNRRIAELASSGI